MNGNSSSLPGKSHIDAQQARRLLSSTGAESSESKRKDGSATPIRIVLVFIGICLIVGLVAFLLVHFVYRSPATGQSLTCPGEEILFQKSHTKCDSLIQYQENCVSKNAWTKQNNLYLSMDSDIQGVVWASPPYLSNSNTCGIQLSMATSSNTNITAVVYTNDTHYTVYNSIQVSKDKCETFVFREKALSMNHTKARIFLVFSSEVNPNDTRLELSALPCSFTLSSVRKQNHKTTKPTFKKVRVTDSDFCSVGVVKEHREDRNCDWWNMAEGDSANFQTMSYHYCVENSANMKIGTWFLGLQSTTKHTTANFLSPLIMRESNTLLLDFWYVMKCTGITIKVYLLHSPELMTDRAIIKSIDKEPQHAAWIHQKLRIDLPSNYESFHVLIEGEIPARAESNCSYSVCSASNPIIAEEPFLGIDDILLTLEKPACKSSGVSDKLSCSFQNDTKATKCLWLSSMPPSITFYMETFADFKTKNNIENPHSDNTGHVVHFDASGKRGMTSFMRTPLLVANDNCSCQMSFLYLMDGYDSPRLQVAVIHENSTGEDVKWSAISDQGAKWKTARFSLNIDTARRFQIRFQIREVTTWSEDIYIDDIIFENCDISLA